MLTIVYCTRKTNQEHKEHLMKTSGLHKHVEVIEIINNGESLTSAYNRGLKMATNNIVVFCHDDLIVETKQWGHKLLKLFEKNPEYGIIGVAGSKEMPANGQWWSNKKQMYGRVAHTHEGKTWLSSYSADLGHDIEETVLVDGVFFAVDKTKIENQFNEKVEGFHFYDVTFCFENYLSGVKIGVTTVVRINHKSIGMTNDDWEKNRQQFVETFSAELPASIKKVLRKGERLKVLIGCLTLNGSGVDEVVTMALIERLIKDNCDITLVTNINTKNAQTLKRAGVKVFTIQEPPNFKLGDGKWKLKSPEGDVTSQLNVLYKVSDSYFDVLYLSQKPVIDHLVRLYPNTDIVNIIHSADKPIDTPLIDSQVVKYIATNEEVKEHLLNIHSIDNNIIEVYESKIDTSVKQRIFKPSAIKIVTGWSNRGGSTTALISLTNALNKAGYDTTLYGPHRWHLDKCKAKLFDGNINAEPTDRLIAHFIQPPTRPNVSKVILACHEKNLFEVGRVNQYWDEVVFLNERHRAYHSSYNGKYSIIPNLKEPFNRRDKTGLEKIAGIIGSFDENKQTHVSIQRALADGCEKVYLFGEPETPYYHEYVKPLLSDKVLLPGFMNNKQAMYDMIGCVYHSSISEVACLVKDECESTGVVFKGTEVTDNPIVLLTNDEIIKEWVKILEL